MAGAMHRRFGYRRNMAGVLKEMETLYPSRWDQCYRRNMAGVLKEMETLYPSRWDQCCLSL